MNRMSAAFFVVSAEVVIVVGGGVAVAAIVADIVVGPLVGAKVVEWMVAAPSSAFVLGAPIIIVVVVVVVVVAVDGVRSCCTSSLVGSCPWTLNVSTAIDVVRGGGGIGERRRRIEQGEDRLRQLTSPHFILDHGCNVLTGAWQ